MEFGSIKTQSLAFAWRIPLGFQIVFLLPHTSGRSLPRISSPPSQDRRLDEARDILERCRVNPNIPELDQEMGEIKYAIQLEAKPATSTYYGVLFNKDELHTRRRILLGGGI
jgi:hypothetical protein